MSGSSGVLSIKVNYAKSMFVCVVHHLILKLPVLALLRL